MIGRIKVQEGDKMVKAQVLADHLSLLQWSDFILFFKKSIRQELWFNIATVSGV